MLEKGPLILVDDNEVDIQIFSRYLKSSNLENPLLSFQNGRDFLAYMKSVEEGSKERPAIVFIDVNMPEMSGFEVLVKLKELMKSQNAIRLVVLSSSDHPTDKEKALSLQAQYVEKFFDVDEAVYFLNSL